MKKNLILIALPILMSSCAMLPSPSSYMGIIDYSPLIKNGIYVTESNSVNFKYTPIGSVISEDIAGYENGQYVRPNIEDAFDKIKNKMKELDANGIINLKITNSTYYDGFYKMNLPMLTISGMAIRSEEIKLPVTNIKSFSNAKNSPILGEIDGIECKVIENTGSGIRILTDKELSKEQMKRVKSELSIKQEQIMFNLPDKMQKEDAYAGITGEYIIIYKTNEFIQIK